MSFDDRSNSLLCNIERGAAVRFLSEYIDSVLLERQIKHLKDSSIRLDGTVKLMSVLKGIGNLTKGT